MEFKTKVALTESANHQTMPEIAAYYNGLLGVKQAKKLESREVAVTPPRAHGRGGVWTRSCWNYFAIL